MRTHETKGDKRGQGRHREINGDKEKARVKRRQEETSRDKRRPRETKGDQTRQSETKRRQEETEG